MTAERRFDVSAAFPPNAQQNDLYQHIGESALDWLWDGFNAAIIAHGQTQTGKTYSLFGHSTVGDSGGEGICLRLLAALFNRIAHAVPAPEAFTVGMSCWDVHGQFVTDLLTPEAAGTLHFLVFCWLV